MSESNGSVSEDGGGRSTPQSADRWLPPPRHRPWHPTRRGRLTVLAHISSLPLARACWHRYSKRDRDFQTAIISNQVALAARPPSASAYKRCSRRTTTPPIRARPLAPADSDCVDGLLLLASAFLVPDLCCARVRTGTGT